MVVLSEKQKVFGFDAVAKGIERIGVAIDGYTGRIGVPHLRPSTYINVLGGLGLAFGPEYARMGPGAKDAGVLVGGHMFNKVWDYLEEYLPVAPPAAGTPRVTGRYAAETPGGAPEFRPPLYGRRLSPEPVIKNHVRYSLALEG
jgi:hypothetical protein